MQTGQGTFLKNVSAPCLTTDMTNAHNKPDTTANYLGLMLMLGLPAEKLEKYGQEVEIPDGHLEDRMIELIELREGWR